MKQVANLTDLADLYAKASNGVVQYLIQIQFIKECRNNQLPL
jgi:hypothetical protein